MINEELVSIIIPYYDSPSNNTDNLDAMLKSLKEHEAGYCYEVVVAKGKKSRLDNIHDGIDKAQGRYILVCDDDLLFIQNDWLKDLMTVFTIKEKVGMVGALMLRKDKQTIEHGGSILLPDSGVFKRDTVPDFLKKVTSDYNQIKLVSQVAGCFMLYDRLIVGYFPVRVYPEVGGWEDLDFQAQIQGTGFDIYINQNVRVIHDMIEDDAERDKKYDGQQMRKTKNLTRYAERWKKY